MLRMTAFALALVACNADRVTAPNAVLVKGRTSHANGPAGPVIRISEFHYDNVGTDVGERIEVSGPAGISVAGWQIVRYNGATSTAAFSYGVTNITGVFPSQCSGRGTLVFAYPTDGLQNGTNDGFALVNATGKVIELLSYEGVMTASNGPAAGKTSVDVGVSQSNNTTPVGASIERTPTGTWVGRTVNSFGTCNDDDGNVDPGFGPLASVTVAPTTANITVGGTLAFSATGLDADGNEVTNAVFTWSTPNPELVTVNSTSGVVTASVIGDTKVIATSGAFSAEAIVHVVAPPPPPADLPPTRFSEIHYDNAGTDANEAIEVEGAAGVNLSGWSIVLYTGSNGTVYRTEALSGVFTATCNGRGAISFPIAGIQNGGFDTAEPDGFALVHGTDLVQFLSYEGQFAAADGPAAGLTSTDIGVEEGSSTTDAQSLQLSTAGVWEKKSATFGAVNACAAATGSSSISIAANGPDTLVVGWQRRAFVTFRDANGTTVSPTPTITWTSDTPDLASVDARGYATALSAGTAIIRATIGTTTKTYSISIIAYEPVKAQYRNHVEFGVPTGADPANDVPLTKPGFVTSYNPARGGPNWVSWNINTSTFGNAERCECFSGDIALPSSQRIVDFDYVSGGYDRGHMVQSESRTSTHSENAASFLMTNILPQAANNNQGPWLGFENFLNDRARVDGKQVYVVAGGEYSASPTTLKGEGKVAIPDYTWKVAIVMNNGLGLADVHSVSDITVYAIRIPNLLATAPAKNNNYLPYVTTIDDVEARTGYDFFAALPDNIERIVESNDHPPVAVIGGDASGFEGSALNFDASGSTDPDVGDVLTYQWTFGTAGSSTDAHPTFTFSDDGTYLVTLVVTDKYGATSVQTKSVTIANVAPTVGTFAGATIIRGESYGTTGGFTDPGADTFTATVNYGDGSGTQPLTLSGTSFSLAHSYLAAGTFTVVVTVVDDDLGTSSRSSTVVVASAAEAIGTLSTKAAALAADGTISNGESNALDASLRNALKSLDKDNPTPARNQLEAFINKVEAMQQSGRLDATTANALITYARRIITSIG